MNVRAGHLGLVIKATKPNSDTANLVLHSSNCLVKTSWTLVTQFFFQFDSSYWPLFRWINKSDERWELNEWESSRVSQPAKPWSSDTKLNTDININSKNEEKSDQEEKQQQMLVLYRDQAKTSQAWGDRGRLGLHQRAPYVVAMVTGSRRRWRNLQYLKMDDGCSMSRCAFTKTIKESQEKKKMEKLRRNWKF